MEITEIRVKLMPRRADKLRAFCCITLDGQFVVRDLKIIEGPRGVFVAMPSRKVMSRCAACGGKNHLRARYCNDCGASQAEGRPARDPEGRVRHHADIAHPIHAAARETMHRRILSAFAEEVERSRLPGYKPVELYESPDEYDVDDVAHASR